MRERLRKELPGAEPWPAAHDTQVQVDPVTNNAGTQPVRTDWIQSVDPGYVHGHALTPKGQPQLPTRRPLVDTFGMDWIANTVRMAGLLMTRLPTWGLGTGTVGAAGHADKHFADDPGRYSRMARAVAAEVVAVAGVLKAQKDTAARVALTPLLASTEALAKQVLTDLEVEATRPLTYRKVGPLMISLWALWSFLLFELAQDERNGTLTPAGTRALPAARRASARFKLRLHYPTSTPNTYTLQFVWQWTDLPGPSGSWPTEVNGDLEPSSGTRAAGAHGPAWALCSLRLGRSYHHVPPVRRAVVRPAVYLLVQPLVVTTFGDYGSVRAAQSGRDCELMVDAERTGNGTLAVK